jgi:hypothetical protein
LRFWDTSAIVSLLALEGPSWKTMELFRQDPDMAYWWGTPVECVSTLTRFEREGQVAEAALQLAAALAWRQGYPGGATFVTLDRRLRGAAAVEGFRVLPYADEIHEHSSLLDGLVSELRDHTPPPYPR